jgi:PKD repeat protein
MSASHTYATGGTYVVAVTVTDDRGGTATTSTSVTVAAAPNEAPTAAFTSATQDLTASFDGTGSTDPDGTVVAYSWDFGDDSTGTGPTVNHTFATAGTYTVTLTVTDDLGGTDTATASVTVAAPAVVARDAFGRTVATGWGAADVGGSWTVIGATANLSVAGGVGRMRMSAGGGPGAYLNEVVAANVDARVAVGYDKPGSGGGIYTSLVVRRIGTSDYRVKVRITATAITVYIVRTVNGVETTLATQTLPGGAYNVGELLNLRLQVQGTGTTTIRAKVWRSGGAEPATWTATATDSTAALQAAGATGLYSYLSGSATNAPVTGTFDSFEVTPI